jgi:hypothetical protein
MIGICGKRVNGCEVCCFAEVEIGEIEEIVEGGLGSFKA